MTLRLGSAAPTALRVGSAAVTRAYLGSTLVADWATPVGSQVVNPTADTSTIFANPERGWFQYTETHWTDSSGSGHSALDSAALAAARTGSTTINGATYPARTLVFRYYIMEHWRGVDTLSQAYLDAIAADIVAARTAGIKLILRFSYGNTWDGVEDGAYGQDTTPTRTLGHVSQLAATLNAGADVIHAVQAGFIGIWGEWYYTDNWGDRGTLTTAQWHDRARLVTALLGLDSRIFILLRYPGLKHRYIAEGSGTGWTAPSGAIGRLGFHNDAFLADNAGEDWGTYSTFANGQSVAQLRSYVQTETARPVPLLGETAGVSSRSGYANAETEMETLRWSSLNPNYHPDVLSSWSQANKDEASLKFGSRLRVTTATLPSGGGTGATAPVSLTIANDGWGYPLRERTAQLVFVNGATVVTRDLTGDIRDAEPGETLTLTGSVALPTTAGTYSMHLLLADPSLPSRPEYAIRLAHATGWDAATGRNALGASVTVQTA